MRVRSVGSRTRGRWGWMIHLNLNPVQLGITRSRIPYEQKVYLQTLNNNNNNTNNEE